jgi:hypothetical protein
MTVTAQKDILDPNSPDVFTNPDRVRLMDPADQMIATINLAQTGQLVGGDNIRTLEAILAGAGYQMVLDGQLSADEQAALKNFKDKLEDKDFKETANELLGMLIGAPEEGKLQMPALNQMVEAFMPERASPARKATIVSDPF